MTANPPWSFQPLPVEGDAPAASRFPFTPYPAGWFRVAASASLAPGVVQALRYFGRDLVAFRTRSGRARVLDAHCPHLGAHLGVGGRVDGEHLCCPFHGWRIGVDGRCAHAPSAGRAHPRAGTRAWPVEERNGQVLVYHHPRGEAPDWSLPEWPEHADPAWTSFRPANRWVIRTHVQEMGENGVDSAHFTHLHPQQTLAMSTRAVEIDGPVFVHRTFQHYNLFGLAKLLLDDVSGPLDVTLHGLGCAINRTCVQARIELEYAYAFWFTPVDGERIEVHSTLAMRRLPGRLLTWLLWRKAVGEGRKTIDQDVPIWESKRYREHPALVEGDGPIMQFRRWARQFYPDAAAP